MTRSIFHRTREFGDDIQENYPIDIRKRMSYQHQLKCFQFLEFKNFKLTFRCECFSLVNLSNNINIYLS